MSTTARSGSDHSLGESPTPDVMKTIGRPRRWLSFARNAAVIVVIVAAVLLIRSHRGGPVRYDWNFGVIGDVWPALARGLLVTLELTAICTVTSMVVGVFVAAARMSSNVVLRGLVTVYIEVMRSTPLLIQLVWIFYTLPILTGLNIPSFESAVLGLTIHGAAYYGEAFRAGIQAVPTEHKEAAVVLGLKPSQRLRLVVLPQAVRNVLPVLVTQCLLMLKDTSLVSVLGLNDLFNAGNSAALATYRPLEILTVVGIVYFVIGFPISLLARRVELRLMRRSG